MNAPVSVALGRSLARAAAALVSAAVTFWIAYTSGASPTLALVAAAVVSLLVGRAVRCALLTPEERAKP